MHRNELLLFKTFKILNMTLQNRVNPWGKLHQHPSKKAMLMGNRGGRLHNSNKQIIKQWATQSWIHCLTTFGNIKREVFGDSYSELFFLDEATALSAGHRPCGECQRKRYQEFKKIWLNINNAGISISAKEMDKRIHQDRINAEKMQHTFQANLSELPIGTFFEYASEAIVVYKENCYLIWSFDGYQKKIELPQNLIVTVLTPQTFVKMFDHGYVPNFHSSASLKII